MLGEGRPVTISQRKLASDLQNTIDHNSCYDDNSDTDLWQTIHLRLDNILSEKQARQVAGALWMHEFDTDDLIDAAVSGNLLVWLEENLAGFGEYPENDLFKVVFSWESRDEILSLTDNQEFSNSIDGFFPNNFNFCSAPEGVARMLAVEKHADEKIPHVPVQQSIMSWFKLAA